MRRERRLQQLWPKHLASINNPTIVRRRTLVRTRKTHLRSVPQFRVFFNNCGKIPKRAGYPDPPLPIFQKHGTRRSSEGPGLGLHPNLNQKGRLPVSINQMAASHTATKTTITAVRITLPHICPARAGRLGVEAGKQPRGAFKGPPGDRNPLK